MVIPLICNPTVKRKRQKEFTPNGEANKEDEEEELLHGEEKHLSELLTGRAHLKVFTRLNIKKEKKKINK